MINKIYVFQDNKDEHPIETHIVEGAKESVRKRIIEIVQDHQSIDPIFIQYEIDGISSEIYDAGSSEYSILLLKLS